VVAVGLGTTISPGPTQLFSLTPSTELLTQFLLVLVPTFLVPLAIMVHVVSLWQLCWHHPRLWSLLREKTDPQPSIPAWPQFLRGYIQNRESLDRQLPATPRTSGEFQGRR
jgi:hypothetical protein